MLLVSNWKMNPVSLKEARRLLRSLTQTQNVKCGSARLSWPAKNKASIDLWLAPPSLFVYPLIQQFGHYFTFGLQNIFYEKQGAYTGELSATQAKDIGAKFVILGHSERKKMGEDLETINKKVISALAAGLKVILCFGETTRQNNLTASAREWEQQAAILFRNLPETAAVKKKLIIAFEPAWAISTQGQGSVSVEYLRAFINWFNQKVRKNFDAVKLLYGGSVDAAVAGRFSQTGLDGFLIGSASLQLAEFKKIISLCYNIIPNEKKNKKSK